MGPYARYDENRDPHLHVMRKHRDAAYRLPTSGVPTDVLEAAHVVYDEALELGKEFGYRNAQATVLAPTGTLSFLMDCDTTGIEPDFALVKFKKLAGGGYFKIVNQSVPDALARLGYGAAQIKEIVAYVSGTNTFAGAPHAAPGMRRSRSARSTATATRRPLFWRPRGRSRSSWTATPRASSPTSPWSSSRSWSAAVR